MKVVMMSVAAACFAATAAAQTDAPMAAAAPMLDVAAMDCEQMRAEMVAAGQLMNQQMDPNLGADIQAMQADSQRQMGQATTAAIGSGLICAVPGMGAACAAAMNAQAARQAGQAEVNRERMGAMVESVQGATAGIDMARMTAMSERWESQRCEMPQH